MISYGNGSGDCNDGYDGNDCEQILNKKININNEYYAEKLVNFYKVKLANTKNTYKYIQILTKLVKRYEILTPILEELIKKHKIRYDEERKTIEKSKKLTRRVKQTAIERKLQIEMENKYCEELNFEIANTKLKKSSYYPRKSFY